MGAFLHARCHEVGLLQSSATRGLLMMADVSSILKQLKKERDHVANHLSGIDAALTAFSNAYGALASLDASGRK